MKVQLFGAAGEVTGSCFHVETTAGRFVIDCGMFQGAKAQELRNAKLPFDVRSVDAVFLTHAHLDHCGRLPLMVRQGYQGKFHGTASTCDITQYILLDSARLQEEDFERRTRKGRRSGIKALPLLYSEQDVLRVMRRFEEHPFETAIPMGNGVEVVLHQSGHILGSSSIEIRENGTSALFSGDLGAPQHNVVPDPTPAVPCDLVFVESTYGNRLHRTEEESVSELKEAINWAHKAGGNVVIPSFALERTQDILFYLRGLRVRGEVPSLPVFLDSPLAINITEVYEHHRDDLDDTTRAVFDKKADPFWFPGLTKCVTTNQSKTINDKDHAIIIAGSGMCNGGRIVHHLLHNLWRSDSAVVFVGFQAEGTLGRQIIEGAKVVNVEHERVAVRARVFTINGFSAHADQTALLNWLAPSGRAHIVACHGEPDASSELVNKLTAQGRSAEVATYGRVYDTEEIKVPV